MKIFFFFLLSQVPSFRHTKQTSKDVADTTFKELCHDPWSIHNNLGNLKLELDTAASSYGSVTSLQILKTKEITQFVTNNLKIAN